jgi:hypothetical protein
MKDMGLGITVRGKKKGTKSDNRVYPLRLKPKNDLIFHTLDGENLLLKYGFDESLVHKSSNSRSKINYFNKTMEELQKE